jgi:hypothetical protein
MQVEDVSDGNNNDKGPATNGAAICKVQQGRGE